MELVLPLVRLLFVMRIQLIPAMLMITVKERLNAVMMVAVPTVVRRVKYMCQVQSNIHLALWVKFSAGIILKYFSQKKRFDISCQ